MATSNLKKLSSSWRIVECFQLSFLLSIAYFPNVSILQQGTIGMLVLCSSFPLYWKLESKSWKAFPLYQKLESTIGSLKVQRNLVLSRQSPLYTQLSRWQSISFLIAAMTINRVFVWLKPTVPLNTKKISEIYFKFTVFILSKKYFLIIYQKALF